MTRPLPDYYDQKQVLRRLGMSRQNFHQRGLADAIEPVAVFGGSPIYDVEEVKLWARWLHVRRGLIELGALPHSTPIVAEDGRVPGYVESGEYEEDCPVCGKLAIAPFDAEDGRLWCGVDGIIERGRE